MRDTLNHFLLLCTLLSSVVTTVKAESVLEVKKLLFSDCNKAIIAANHIVPEERASVVTFLESVISNSTALRQPVLSAPNVAAPFTDEPKIGEIIAINSIDRDTAAKKCALKVAPIFFPESLILIPKLIWSAGNKDFPKDLRDILPETASHWLAKTTDPASKKAFLKEAVRAFARDHQNAAAQNAVLELAFEDLEYFFSTLNDAAYTVDSPMVTKVLEIIDPGFGHSGEFFKKMSLEAGNARTLGFLLLKNISRDKLLADQEWIRKIASLAVDPQYQQLIDELEIYKITDTQDSLVNLLKGAGPEERDNILTLLTKYQAIHQGAEDQFIKRSLLQDSISNAPIRDVLISIASRQGTDPVSKKKWAKYAAANFAAFIASTEPSSPEFIEFIVSYAPELQDVFKQTWADKKINNKKWLQAYIDWRQSIGTANFAKATTTFVSSFWKEQPPLWMEDLVKVKFVEVIKGATWQVNKTLLPAIKSLVSNKTAKSAERNLGLTLLYLVDPKKLSKAESKELLASADCSMVNTKELYVLSGLNVEEYFSTYLGCYQRGLIQRAKVKDFFLNKDLGLDARQKLFLTSIDNLLYDRAFRSNLLSVAGALNINLASLKDTIHGLLNDADALVQKEVLTSLGHHSNDQLQAILPVLKAFIDENQNVPENRSIAAVLYIRASVGEPQPLVELIQTLLDSPPLAKALIAQYKELPSMMYVQALSNRFAELEPSVKIEALESLLKATEPVLLDGIPIEVLYRLKDSKVESVKDLAELAIILKTLATGPEAESMLKHALYTGSRWKLLDSPLRSRIPQEVASKLKQELCPQGKTPCMILEAVRR